LFVHPTWFCYTNVSYEERTIGNEKVYPHHLRSNAGGCDDHADALPRQVCLLSHLLGHTTKLYAGIAAVLRGIDVSSILARQVRVRLDGLADMGHPIDKIELIIMGGTFLATPKDYQYHFIKDCFDALNGIVSPSLDDAKKRNENAACRCVGLCVETRPDFCGEKEVKRMLEFARRE